MKAIKRQLLTESQFLWHLKRDEMERMECFCGDVSADSLCFIYLLSSCAFCFLGFYIKACM